MVWNMFLKNNQIKRSGKSVDITWWIRGQTMELGGLRTHHTSAIYFSWGHGQISLTMVLHCPHPLTMDDRSHPKELLGKVNEVIHFKCLEDCLPPPPKKNQYSVRFNDYYYYFQRFLLEKWKERSLTFLLQLDQMQSAVLWQAHWVVYWSPKGIESNFRPDVLSERWRWWCQPRVLDKQEEKPGYGWTQTETLRKTNVKRTRGNRPTVYFCDCDHAREDSWQWDLWKITSISAFTTGSERQEMGNIEEIWGGCDELNKLRFEKGFCRKLRESTQPRAISRAVLERWESTMRCDRQKTRKADMFQARRLGREKLTQSLDLMAKL